MFCFGAIGGAFTGKDDIFYVMIAQGLAIPAIIVLGSQYLDNQQQCTVHRRSCNLEHHQCKNEDRYLYFRCDRYSTCDLVIL